MKYIHKNLSKTHTSLINSKMLFSSMTTYGAGIWQGKNCNFCFNRSPISLDFESRDYWLFRLLQRYVVGKTSLRKSRFESLSKTFSHQFYSKAIHELPDNFQPPEMHISTVQRINLNGLWFDFLNGWYIYFLRLIVIICKGNVLYTTMVISGCQNFLCSDWQIFSFIVEIRRAFQKFWDLFLIEAVITALD